MSDPLRTNPTNESPASIDGDAERDAKIESLLHCGARSIFRRALRASHRHLDARAVSRSQSRAGTRVHRSRPQRDGRTAARVGRAAAQRRGGVRAGRDRGGAADAECRSAARRRSRCGARVSHAHRSHSRRDADGAGADGPAVETAVRPRTVASDRPGSRWASAMFVDVLLVAGGCRASPRGISFACGYRR